MKIPNIKNCLDEIYKQFLNLLRTDKNDRTCFKDPYFNFSLDLSQAVLIFITTNKLPYVFENRLKKLEVSPDLIQSTKRNETIQQAIVDVQQQASSSHATSSHHLSIDHENFPSVILNASVQNSSENKEIASTTRQALGHNASIGDLYNAREDVLLGQNLFTNKVPINLCCITNHSMKDKIVDEMIGDALEEKFKHLSVEDELKVRDHPLSQVIKKSKITPFSLVIFGQGLKIFHKIFKKL